MPREEVSFARGTKATMPQNKVPGRLLIATDTGEAYVDDTTTSRVQLKDTTKVSKSGDTMSGPLNMGSNKITNVATPTADTDAANLGSVKSETAKVKYTGGTAITVDDGNKTISHNTIGIAGSVGPSANATPAPGGTFNVPQITTDAQGHVSSKTNRTVTIPQYSAGTGLSISGTAISHANNGTAGSYGPTGNVTPGYGGTFEIPQITTNAQGHVTAITMRTVRLPSAQDIPEVETYTGVSPITVSGTQISHNNIGTAGSVGPTGNSTATHGGTITIPYITVDAKGHVSAKSNRTITLPAGPVNMRGATSSAAGSAGYVPAPAAGASNRYLRSDGTWAVPASTTYTAARGLSLSGTEIGHSNSAITAGNRGPTANATISPGSTFSVPQIYYDAYGHVTSSATNRTMTLNSSILDTSDILTSLSSATNNTKVLGAKLVADAINDLNSQVSTLNTNLSNDIQRRTQCNFDMSNVICVSDSFGEGYNPDGAATVPWCERLQVYFDYDNWHNIAEGGIGFQHVSGSTRHNAVQCWNAHKSEIAWLNKATTVICLFGHNDRDQSSATSEDAARLTASVRSFFDQVMSDCPNAKIIWMMNPTNVIFKRAIIATVLRCQNLYTGYDKLTVFDSWYWNIFTRPNGIYEQMLWTSDGIHPNSSGQTMIARQIYHAMHGGCPYNNTYVHLADDISNSNCGLYVYGPVSTLYISYSNYVARRSNTIGRFPANMFYGSNAGPYASYADTVNLNDVLWGTINYGGDYGRSIYLFQPTVNQSSYQSGNVRTCITLDTFEFACIG